MKKLSLPVLFAAFFACGLARATVIDFNAEGWGCSQGPYYSSGVSFSAVRGVLISSGVNGTGSLSTQCFLNEGDFAPIRADFTAPFTGMIAVDLGDYATDADDLFLRLFDSSSNLLTEVARTIDSSFTGMVTLRAAASDVSYAIFGGHGGLGSSVYADNFTFRGHVAEPGTIALLGLALLGLLGASRRGLTTVTLPPPAVPT